MLRVSSDEAASTSIIPGERTEGGAEPAVGQRGGMKLSVIIANYNYGDFVGAAIESALAVDWPDKEVIVVDDASTDELEKGHRWFQRQSGSLLQAEIPPTRRPHVRLRAEHRRRHHFSRRRRFAGTGGHAGGRKGMAAGCLKGSISDEPDRRDRHPVGIRNSAISAKGRSRKAPPHLSCAPWHTQRLRDRATPIPGILYTMSSRSLLRFPSQTPYC